MEEKNNEVNKYIDNISRYLNLKYPNILSDDKISRAKSMFNNSDEDIDLIKRKIDILAKQTISNWELGETSPNPEQLLLLSKILETSVDNLLGNNMIFKDSNEKINYISSGSMIVCGTIAGIWAFTANRFNLHEIILIIIGGIAIGYGINLVINGVLKKLECKNTIIEEDNTKSKKTK